MAKTLYLLIGPKGAGKTAIGAMLEAQTGITFLRVEPLWLGLAPGEDGWAKVQAAVEALFQDHDRLIIESLGLGPGFQRLRAALAAKYSLRLIRVRAGLETCFARLKSRTSALQVPVPEELVREYNRLAADLEYPWDLEIDNSGPAGPGEILAAFRSLLPPGESEP